MRRIMRTLGSLALLATLLVASAAQARTELIRWGHDDPDSVDFFRIHYGPAPGVYDQTVDLTSWTTVNPVTFIATIEVPDADTIYMAMTAHSGGVASPYSNEKMRVGIAVDDEPSPPPPDDSGAIAKIVILQLWDVQNGTLLRSNFGSGATINTSATPCTAILVIGNSYLTGSGVFGAGEPGSVRFDFDGSNPNGACWLAGTSHQNEPPYVWESKTLTGALECAPTLTEVGAHTLTVTPFEGDDCSGAQGPTVSVSFSVVADGGTPAPAPEPEPEPEPPAEPEPLGAPGQPVLLQ